MKLSRDELIIVSHCILWVEELKLEHTVPLESALPKSQRKAVDDYIMSLIRSIPVVSQPEETKQAFRDVELSQDEVSWIADCIETVLQECADDPLELDIRVASPDKVRQVLKKFR